MAFHDLLWLTLMVTLALFACDKAYDYDYDVDIATWPHCTQAKDAFKVVQPGITNENITWLHLQKCNGSLQADDLKYYPKLEKLSLFGTGVDFNDETLSLLPYLEILDLNNNGFSGKNLPPNLLRNNQNLFRVTITSNDMVDTPIDLFLGVNDTIIMLTITNCSLRAMPLFFTRIMFPDMNYMDFSKNNIWALDDPTTFANVPNVDQIFMSDNQIEYLHVDLLKPLVSVTTITLDGNKIRYIPEVFFQNKSSLSFVSLNRNLLEYLPAKAFQGSGLSFLQISDNRLTHLPGNWFSELQRSGVSLDSFGFERNPWECACLNEILVTIKELNIFYLNHLYEGYNAVCVITITDSFKCHRPDIYQNLYDELLKS